MLARLRPLLIQELEWSPPGVSSGAPKMPTRDSVAAVVFGFCNGELNPIVVAYDGDKTEGLTEQDMQKTRDDAERAAHAVARVANKAAFRY
jgi:hypothetical protein